MDLKRYGRENSEKPLDTTPVEIPLGAGRPKSLTDVIAQMVRQQIQETQEEEFESISESDDFEEEDPDTLDLTPYTLQDIPEELPTLASLQEPVEQDQGAGEAEALVETEPSASADSPRNSDTPNPDE